MGEKKNITLIIYQYSVIVKGLERKLKDLGYDVFTIVSDFGHIKASAIKPDLYILYLPKLVQNDESQNDALEYICNEVWGTGVKMFVIGESGDHRYLCSQHAILECYDWFDRPLNMERFTNSVKKAMTEPIIADGRKRILLVDDDMTYAEMIRGWLKDYYRVYIVTAGMNAISFLIRNRADLILLDYEMPVVNGAQVLQMLRQEPATRDLPVIFLTGVGSRENVEQVLALKPDGYVLKNTTRENLLEILNNKLKDKFFNH
ncbi:MAG: response regulator [Anaerovibrio sp.]|nr:response regulator [Anaerovibrio sp.]